MKPSRSSDAKPPLVATAGGAAVLSAAVEQLSAAEPAKREVPKQLAELLEKIPTPDAAVVEEVFPKLAQGGPATVEKLIELVGGEFGDPQGVKPKFALHGLVHYASRPGADAQRKMVAETLAKQLTADHSDELKAFICRQLQLCGRPEEVPALAGLLGSDRLCEPATQAMLAIGGQQATAALRDALPKATGRRASTIIKALGRLMDRASAAAIRKAAGDSDRNVRLTAWYALGNMGDAASADLLLSAAETETPYERTQATDACLLLGRRLAEAGAAKDAEKVFRQLLSRRQTAEDVHDRCAALEGLAEAIGTAAVDDVLAALDSRQQKYRHPAARTAVDLARSIQKSQPQQAEKLFKKVLDATQEEAVRQQAQILLGRGGR